MAILFFVCSLGINLYFYNLELEGKKEETKEGFVTSQSGILTDISGNILYCNASQIGQIINGGKCMDISYIDQNSKIQSSQKVVIYPNYYVDSKSGLLQPVPYGYIANASQTGYFAISKTGLIETSNNTFILPMSNSGPSYSTNIDISFHQLYKGADDSNGLPPGKMWFPNGDGTASIIDIDSYNQNTFYYETATYDAGPRNFVPVNEESIYISKLGSKNIQDYKNKDPIYLAGAPISSSLYKNIGELYANNSAKLEVACNKMDQYTCASSTSCALLGGQKCVSANENGPILKSNYSDFTIVNRDYYYYQGKCYGMCPNTQ